MPPGSDKIPLIRAYIATADLEPEPTPVSHLSVVRSEEPGHAGPEIEVEPEDASESARTRDHERDLFTQPLFDSWQTGRAGSEGAQLTYEEWSRVGTAVARLVGLDNIWPPPSPPPRALPRCALGSIIRLFPIFESAVRHAGAAAPR